MSFKKRKGSSQVDKISTPEETSITTVVDMNDPLVLYKRAGDILLKVVQKRSTIKGLVFGSIDLPTRKKKLMFALVAQTLKCKSREGRRLFPSYSQVVVKRKPSKT